MDANSWTPPENPDPHEIMHSAVADTRNGLYEQALSKFLWFHNNALNYSRAFFGVRTSFALGYWLELAAVYPPAQDAFVRTRDETETAFRNDPSSFDSFHDLARLNKRLGDELRTVELFAVVADSDLVTARSLYLVAESCLVAAGRYRECAPFLEVESRMLMAARSYEMMKCHEASRPDAGIPIPMHAEDHYVRNVATLAALLVINDRVDDANKVCNDALQIVESDEAREILLSAKTGQLPKRAW